MESSRIVGAKVGRLLENVELDAKDNLYSHFHWGFSGSQRKESLIKQRHNSKENQGLSISVSSLVPSPYNLRSLLHFGGSLACMLNLTLKALSSFQPITLIDAFFILF